MTVSTLSAMISRVCSEKRIPSPPMVMASDTPGKAQFSAHLLKPVILLERTYGVELPFCGVSVSISSNMRLVNQIGRVL